LIDDVLSSKEDNNCSDQMEGEDAMTDMLTNATQHLTSYFEEEDGNQLKEASNGIKKKFP
jgi:hypothetical protein